MRNQIALAAAAILTVGGLNIGALHAQDNAAERAGAQIERGADKTAAELQRTADRLNDNTDQRVAGAGADQLPAGIQRSEKDDAEDVREMLGDVTEAALTKGGFDDVIERFVDADRDRLSKWAAEDGNKQRLAILDGRIDQIRRDFQAKYGQEFDLDEDVVFGNQFKGFTLVQGEIVNPALLSNWPVRNKASQGAGSDGSAVKVDADKVVDATPRRDSVGENLNDAQRDVKDAVRTVTGGDANLNKGRNVAVVTLPASHGAPELTLSLIHELPDAWKIDVPDTVTADRLYEQLLTHLTKFGEMKDQWPADANEAYRAATHHVMAAVYDVNARQGKSEAKK